MKTSPSTILASALRAFFSQHLPLTRGLSPKTLLSYRDAFVLLLRFLATRHACQVVDLEEGLGDRELRLDWTDPDGVQRAWYYIEIALDPEDENTVYVMSAS